MKPSRVEVNARSGRQGTLLRSMSPVIGLRLTPPTACPAWQAGFGSAEQCSAKPCLRPPLLRCAERPTLPFRRRLGGLEVKNRWRIPPRMAGVPLREVKEEERAQPATGDMDGVGPLPSLASRRRQQSTHLGYLDKTN
jgi:hypothetical protein